MEWLEQKNISIIAIPINQRWINIKNCVQKCDGIILSGGSKIHKNDYKLIEYLFKNNIPTLGICLGMQTMARYFSKEKEIKVNNHYSDSKYVHKINISKESILYKILNKEQIMVNSRHHDRIKIANMKISAYSEDGIIEGVEIPTHKCFIGLQWHPETIKDTNSTKILDYFLKSTKNKEPF